MSSFINDEKGVIEPYTELPAMALAVIGFIVFIAVITSQAYASISGEVFHSRSLPGCSKSCREAGQRWIFAGSRPGIIDSEKLETIKNDPSEIIKKYGSYYNFMFKVESNSENRA